MVRKFKKRVNLKQYSPEAELDGHIFSFGRIGAGKSVSTLSMIQGYKDNKGYKIWDMYGGERNEGIFWTLPSNENSYWQKLQVIGNFDENPAKQYRVNLLYPYFESKLPKKLPRKEGVVTSKLFTIPIKDITTKDLMMVLGNVSGTGSYVWEEIQEKIKKKDTCAVLQTLGRKFKGSSSTVFKNFILPMSREKFLMGSNCEYNLDIIEESKDKEAVTVLCLDFVPEKFHLFVINYILRKMMDYLDTNKVKKKNIVFIREAAMFFKATDDSVLEDRFKIFRVNMSNYIRMGRRGMYFALDCQSPTEVRGLVQGSEDYLLMFKTTSWRDKAEMCDELKRERRMRADQIADLAFLEKGEVYIAETGRVVKKTNIILPRTMFWKKEYPNFYRRLWEDRGGRWLMTEEIKDNINEMYNLNKDDYKEDNKPNKKVMSQNIVIPPTQLTQPKKNKDDSNLQQKAKKRRLYSMEEIYAMPLPK